MVVFDLSGNNPNNAIADGANRSTAPATEAGAPYDPSSVTTTFNLPARALYIGTSTGADLSVVTMDGSVRLFLGLVPGGILDVQCRGTVIANTTIDSVIPLF